ncbi:MDGA2 protein, partial [Atractosteus spatula]|nr:MDGA2 protein [Atractosteus spatula]
MAAAARWEQSEQMAAILIGDKESLLCLKKHPAHPLLQPDFRNDHAGAEAACGQPLSVLLLSRSDHSPLAVPGQSRADGHWPSHSPFSSTSPQSLSCCPNPIKRTLRQPAELQKSCLAVVFEGVRGSGFEGDIAIDDVSVTKGRCKQDNPISNTVNVRSVPACRSAPGRQRSALLMSSLSPFWWLCRSTSGRISALAGSLRISTDSSIILRPELHCCQELADHLLPFPAPAPHRTGLCVQGEHFLSISRKDWIPSWPGQSTIQALALGTHTPTRIGPPELGALEQAREGLSQLPTLATLQSSPSRQSLRAAATSSQRPAGLLPLLRPSPLKMMSPQSAPCLPRLALPRRELSLCCLLPLFLPTLFCHLLPPLRPRSSYCKPPVLLSLPLHSSCWTVPSSLFPSHCAHSHGLCCETAVISLLPSSSYSTLHALSCPLCPTPDTKVSNTLPKMLKDLRRRGGSPGEAHLRGVSSLAQSGLALQPELLPRVGPCWATRRTKENCVSKKDKLFVETRNKLHLKVVQSRGWQAQGNGTLRDLGGEHSSRPLMGLCSPLSLESVERNQKQCSRCVRLTACVCVSVCTRTALSQLLSVCCSLCVRLTACVCVSVCTRTALSQLLSVCCSLCVRLTACVCVSVCTRTALSQLLSVCETHSLCLCVCVHTYCTVPACSLFVRLTACVCVSVCLCAHVLHCPSCSRCVRLTACVSVSVCTRTALSQLLSVSETHSLCLCVCVHTYCTVLAALCV